ncbi:hypothetical protein BH10ACT10_BH10ACT10_20640 [soil metagenome]
MDLDDEDTRDAWRRHLGGLLRGRLVICGIAPLAAYPDLVALLELSGARRPLRVATAVGAGAVPRPEQADVVHLDVDSRETMTDDLRRQDAIAHTLPQDVRDAVDAYDPDQEALWLVGPYIGTAPIDGRPVVGGRPQAWTALEDKLLADEIWDAVGGRRAASAIVPVDLVALRSASRALDTGAGVAWAGDALDGFNGGGDFVRRVVDTADEAAALAFFAPRCDRVRVMPFLEGVPCSIHGLVLPDGTAVFRPVELAILRGAGHRFVYGGLGTTWDPPEGDRDEMRSLARRTGEHLRATVGYAGAFGIDGVLTEDGFRPTELNTRMSGGLATLARVVDAPLFTLLQHNLLAGRDPGVGAAALEAWALPRLDAQRVAKPIAMSPRQVGADPFDVHVTWDGTAFSRSWPETGWSVSLGPNPAGTYCRVNPPPGALDGQRVADVNVALMRFLDAEVGTDFGEVVAPPDVRR